MTGSPISSNPEHWISCMVFISSQLVLVTVNGAEKNFAPVRTTLTLEFPNIEAILGFFTRFDLQHKFTQIADIYLVFLRIRGLFWVALDLMRQNIKNLDLPISIIRQN